MSNTSDLIILLLGAMGSIRTETRLVKMAFLCDKNLFRIENYADWAPNNFGPYSYKLNSDKTSLLKDKLIICEDNTVDRFSNKVKRYSLDIKGRKKFLILLGKHSGLQFRIKELLKDFQMDETNYTLLKFVYKNYPNYTKYSKIKNIILNNNS